MNTAARIVKQYLKPLCHPSLMLARFSARSAKAGMWKSRFPPLQAACPAALPGRRQEPFPAAHPSPASPEHDITGVRMAPFIYKGCQLRMSGLAALFLLVPLKMKPACFLLLPDDCRPWWGTFGAFLPMHHFSFFLKM